MGFEKEFGGLLRSRKLIFENTPKKKRRKKVTEEKKPKKIIGLQRERENRVKWKGRD